jgi:hypothetical protein
MGRNPARLKKYLQMTIELVRENYADRQQQLVFAVDDLLEPDVATVQALEAQIHAVAGKFERAREAALANKRVHLSMVEDLDGALCTGWKAGRPGRPVSAAPVCMARGYLCFFLGALKVTVRLTTVLVFFLASD